MEYELGLNELTREIERLLREKGFYENMIGKQDVYAMSALLTTEVSEYTQLFKRHGLDEAHRIEREDEIADIIIRTLNLAVLENVNVAEAVRRKMEYNWGRPYKYNTAEGNQNENPGT